MTQFSVFSFYVLCGLKFTGFMVVKTNNYSFTAAKGVNLFALTAINLRLFGKSVRTLKNVNNTFYWMSEHPKKIHKAFAI